MSRPLVSKSIIALSFVARRGQHKRAGGSGASFPPDGGICSSPTKRHHVELKDPVAILIGERMKDVPPSTRSIATIRDDARAPDQLKP